MQTERQAYNKNKNKIIDTVENLADDEYFVLGDNRNNSEDSRSGNIGPVKRKNITGKAWLHMASAAEGTGIVK